MITPYSYKHKSAIDLHCLYYFLFVPTCKSLYNVELSPISRDSPQIRSCGVLQPQPVFNFLVAVNCEKCLQAKAPVGMGWLKDVCGLWKHHR